MFNIQRSNYDFDSIKYIVVNNKPKNTNKKAPKTNDDNQKEIY